MKILLLTVALFAFSSCPFAEELGQFAKYDFCIEGVNKVQRIRGLTEQELAAASIEERNMNLILRLYEEKNLDIIDQYFTKPIHLQELSTGQNETVSSIKEFDVKWVKAFEQKRLTINEIFAGKDHVVVYWTWHAIHNQGKWQGIPITNKEVAVPGITLYQITNDKIASIVQSSDNLQLLEQLTNGL